MIRNPITLKEVSVAELIPHRGGMKLVHDILQADEISAVTESVVGSNWPLVEGDAVSPIVLIELTAQTAGVSMGWKESIVNGKDIEGRLGWLVGVKEARFYVDSIPINSRVRVHSTKDVSFENYYEIIGTATMDSQVIGEVRLQIVHPDSKGLPP